MADTRLHLAAELNDDQWSVIDDAVERLEQLWKSGPCPEIAPLLPPSGDPLRARLLAEIIKIDQEFRWQAGQQKSLESYLDEWPELEQQPALVAELLEAECVTRAAFGSIPSADDLRRRFPELSDDAREQMLQAAEFARDAALATVNLAPNSTPPNKLRIRCPHCHNPVDLPLDTALTDLTCTACGSHFSLVDQSQATRVAPLLSTMGRFELVERLGVGGFGSVWKARDKELDRTVAIKIPRQNSMTSDEQEKFLREARAAAQLRHPNIVSVHEVGRDGDSLYIVSDFVRGVTLADWLTGQQLTSREAAELCAKIADALDHAHENGIIHRDLKPANIMIDPDGQPHLMDFGLARREVGEVTVTIDGQVLGTPAYMSPEQAQGEAHTADRRSDVYSLGVILFQLLTGELPFRGNTRMLIHQVIHDDPPSPRKFRGNVPKDLETITLKCMEKDPSRRYQNANNVAEELHRYLSGEPIYARPVSRLQRIWRWTKRRPAAAALIATLPMAAMIVAVVATLAAIRLDRERRQTTNSLYQSLIREARALRLARSPGYRIQVFALLQQAARLDTPHLDTHELRDEALCSMGDFAGIPPVTLCGFASSVTALEMGKDLSCIAVGTLDGTVSICDATDPAAVTHAGNLTAPVSYLAISSDESSLVGATQYGRVTRWLRKTTAAEWRQSNSLNIGEGIIAVTADQPTKCFVIRVVDDTHLQIWDIQKGDIVREVTAPGTVFSAAINSDGDMLAAGCWGTQHTLMVWDVASGEVLMTASPQFGGFKDVAFTRDSNQIACACGDGFVYLDSKTGHIISQNKETTYDRLAVAPNRKLCALRARDGRVKLWNIESSAEIAQLDIADAHSIWETTDDLMSYSLGGRWFAFAGTRSVYVWDLLRTPELASLDVHEGGIPAVMFSPDGKFLASVGKDRKCVISDSNSGEQCLVIGSEFNGPLQSVSYHPNGQVLALGGWHDGVTLWDAESGEKLAAPLESKEIWSIAFTEDGEMFAACGRGGVWIWQIKMFAQPETGALKLTATEVAHYDVGQSVYCYFRPNGRDLFWGRFSDIVRFDPDSAELSTLPGIRSVGIFRPFVFLPNGDDLLVINEQGLLQRYSIDNKRVVDTVPYDVARLDPSFMELSPDGRRLALITSRTTVTVVDIDSPVKQFSLPGSSKNSSDVWCVTWAPDGKKLAISCADGSLSIWTLDAITQQLSLIGLPSI